MFGTIPNTFSDSYRNVLFNINHLDRFGGFKIVGLRRLGDIPSSRVND